MPGLGVGTGTAVGGDGVGLGVGVAVGVEVGSTSGGTNSLSGPLTVELPSSLDDNAPTATAITITITTMDASNTLFLPPSARGTRSVGTEGGGGDAA